MNQLRGTQAEECDRASALFFLRARKARALDLFLLGVTRDEDDAEVEEGKRARARMRGRREEG